MTRARTVALLILAMGARTSHAQVTGQWPPDSLVNVQIIARSTSPTAVWGTMRNIAAGLGVECTYCHVGPEGAPLARIDFPSDAKRTKLVARQMMRMMQAVNRGLDSIPDRASPPVAVTCTTCHRGVPRPVTLAAIVADAALASGADSASRAYQALRERYYGHDSYDFGESTLNTAAFRTARGGKTDDALALLRLNEQVFPSAVALHISRGNIHLMRADTSAAVASFREAIRRDPSNDEARGRLRDVGRPPRH